MHWENKNLQHRIIANKIYNSSNTYLKVRSSAENKLLLSFVSASTTSCRNDSYMTGSKKAKSWNLIVLPSIHFITCLFKNIGHNSFCNKQSPSNLKQKTTVN